jgi:hypothetical protein
MSGGHYRRRLQPVAPHVVASPEPPLRRFIPRRGQKLSYDAIRGAWRPSAAVDACGVFAVVWATRTALFWAALHDFDHEAQRRLIDECAWLDRTRGAWIS